MSNPTAADPASQSRPHSRDGIDDGFDPAAQAAPQAGNPVTPHDWPDGLRLVHERSMRERLVAVRAAKNPLLEAAQPLLRALADMPPQLQAASVPTLHSLLEREIVTFQALCAEAGIRHEHAVAGSYALCTALDESASSTPWGGGQGVDTGIWSVRQLASHFHGDAKGGDKLFLLIGRLATTPQEHVDLLELLQQILGLGFQGRFNTATNGRGQLDAIRSRLLSLLASAREDVPIELSPHCRGVGSGKLVLLRSMPVWITALLLASVLAGLFGWYKVRLDRQSDLVMQRIAAVDSTPLPVPRVPAVPPLRLKQLLNNEIARGTVSVEEDARHSAVSFRGDSMFVAGQARIGEKSVATLEKVAREIARVPGEVGVSGHSDNQPIHTRQFPNNQVLSERRAEAVAQVLRDNGVDAARLKVEGKGDSEPLASDATAAGRARNRRVDVVVTAPEPASPSGDGPMTWTPAPHTTR